MSRSSLFKANNKSRRTDAAGADLSAGQRVWEPTTAGDTYALTLGTVDVDFAQWQGVPTTGDEVSLEIVLLGNESELIIKVAARVERTDHDGVALSFHKPLEWWPIFSQFPFHQVATR